MTVKDRVTEFIKTQNISIREFERRCKLSNGYVKGIKHSILPDKMQSISLQFPLLNTSWLMIGEGDMLKGGSSIRHENGSSPQINYENKGVPYYDVDFIAGFDLVQNDQTQTPSCYIDFPQYNNSTYWVNITGKSMEPLISQGDMIAIKELPDWQTYILYGEIYAIVTDEYRTIKKIRKGSDGNNILLVPLNPEYDSQEIPKSIIRSVFQVNGCVKRII